ncbi:Gfo/Idh/MocA family oxidoreductase [Bremerella alba]|uniref:Inositol 2-dehydrogenase/D-chiro-inositol 3-dehydrogenase n=1 Tax=Bremerella alba TaxID=980252 RepID=A0A7V9A797_9BACT|nr:Gfo/Idh/MocA family oxidoreductase [Bremerella alba]MBA2115118.1 Inositol 2-dehydrogenase/D-chiro-inositol 3-dehydrogenase [Bremerella alba]
MSEKSTNSSPEKNVQRRTFLKGSAALGTAAAVGSLSMARSAHAAGNDELKVALIGCGGRGNGAAVNATKGDENLKVTVLADIFPDKVEASKRILGRQLGDRLAVSDENCFSGFDAYKQVMETDVDVVLLCTTPHFRPAHLEAAIAAGKHVFCEKPVAIDAPGCRKVMETVEKAKQKNLSIVSGLCWRYHPSVIATVEKIKEGLIGDVVSMQENYLAGTLWHRGNKEEWSEMEYQIRNWLYYTWLSGDHIAEQAIHSIDKAQWIMDDQTPASCYGMGGREVRTDEDYGNIFDHHAVMFEYAGGQKMFHYTRQMAGCFNQTEDFIMGTKGNAKILAGSIEGQNNWKYDGPSGNMYDLEHKALYDGMRTGNIINNGDYMTKSTMCAIMGRMATYTGKKVTWDEAWNSQEDLTPKSYEWGDVTIPTPIAVPGKTKLV